MKKMKSVFLLALVTMFLTTNFFGQNESVIPFKHNANSAGSSKAERVSIFGVNGVSNQRFEITNATVDNNQFLPALWSHNAGDNSHVIQYHSTISAAQDTGSNPLVRFIASIPQTVNYNAPNSGTQFPWGNGGTQQQVNNRPLFAWQNGSAVAMIMSADNELGIGVTNPTARLHTNGSIRFQSIGSTSSAPYILTIDSSGNVKRQLTSTIGGNNDIDWLDTLGNEPNSISDNIYTLGRVGINISNPTSNLHSNGTVRLQNLATSTSEQYVLTSDSNGNIKKQLSSSVGDSDIDWLDTSGNEPNSINDNLYTLGKVGINTSNPTSNLHSNGTVRFENLPSTTQLLPNIVIDEKDQIFRESRRFTTKTLENKIIDLENIVSELSSKLESQQVLLNALINTKNPQSTKN